MRHAPTEKRLSGVRCRVSERLTRTLKRVAVALPLLAALAQPAFAQARQVAVFAGGCFWGVDAVFRHVKGVVMVVSGYAGGSAAAAEYETVSTGTTGHAESVEVAFDPAQISYEQLLEIFFTVAHDPTQKNRQGPDVGSQYRSVVFFRNEEQRRTAQAVIDRLTRAHAFDKPIVTEVVPLDRFYRAEASHQDYLAHHMSQPYIVYNDLPKLQHLAERFPELYRHDPPPDAAQRTPTQ